MNTNTNTNARETFTDSLKGLGQAWARYGLRLGSVALDAQSKQLASCGEALGKALAGTAKALGDMADTLQAPAAPAPDEVVITPADAAIPREGGAT
ncbi:MAG TPA: hypothetical protein VGM56_13365 [Byssovorax sp.]|jgi:hypothetical protein